MTINFTADRFKDILLKIYGKRRSSTGEKLPYYISDLTEKHILKELTGRQQECFLLYYKKNNTIKEVANILKLSSPTVCKHLQRARKNIYNRVCKYNQGKILWS